MYSNTFEGCNKLTTVLFGNNVTRIPNNAFSGCSKIATITIPNGVTNIGNNAFYDCSGLTDVTVGWTTPINISSNAFGVKNFCILHVPVGTKTKYRSATG